MPVSRRAFLAATAGTALGMQLPAWAAMASADIDEFRQGATPLESGLELDIAGSVENGSYVSVSVEAVSLQSGDDFAEAIMLIAPGNPRPRVAVFQFGALSGQARVATRIRLAGSQEVIALARMKGGSVRIARQPVTVVVGGCDT